MFTAVTLQDANGADVALFNGSRRLGECHGLHGVPAPRRITRPRPGGHGEINETRHYGSRQPVWNGQLIGTSATGLWAEYDALMSTLWGAVSEPRLLKWTRADGKQLQSLVKLADQFDPILRATDAGRVLAYQLMLDREDPRNYSQALQVAVGDPLGAASGGVTYPATYPWHYTPSGAGEADVLNTGTIESPGLFRLYGYVTSPQILLVQTGQRISFTGEVSSGSYLEIDALERSVLLNGTTDRTNLVDFAATDWRAGEIPANTPVTYRLLGANFDASARLDVLWRHAHA